MEPDGDLNPDTDDLPLRANTNHILVRHYVLDLTVHFGRKVISGSVILFLEPCSGGKAEDDVGPGAGTLEAGQSQERARGTLEDKDKVEKGAKGLPTRMEEMFGAGERHRAEVASETGNIQSSHLWETTSEDDFTLVLDCCELDVSKVEEVDVTSVSATSGLSPERSEAGSVNSQAAFTQNLISMASSRWRQKHQLFSSCSQAPGAQDGSSLHFYRDRWSLQVRKKGVASPLEFPRVLRICYETRPTGGSVRWTKDQDNRFVSGANGSESSFHRTVVS